MRLRAELQKSGMLGPLFARLQRVTTSGKFISEIDGLRFIAIGTVILFHINVHPIFDSLRETATALERLLFIPVVDQGFRGVQLFFIISGFILAMPFASHHLKGTKKVRLKDYFLRRITRLEPPYILCMISLFVVLITLKGAAFDEMFPRLAASLGYVHNLIYGEESLINNVAWSLEIEIQFYLLVPILTFLFAIRNRIARRLSIILLSLGSVVGHWLFFSASRTLSLSILSHLHFFLMGFLIADLFIVNWKEQPARSFGWDIVSLLGWPFLVVVWNASHGSAGVGFFSSGNLLSGMLFPLCALCLYCAVFRGKITNAIMTNRWIVTIGGMCYSIYLLHNYIIGATIRLTKDLVIHQSYVLTFFLQFMLVVPVILIFCGAYYVLVERPCMDRFWPRKLATRLGFSTRQIEPPEPAVAVPSKEAAVGRPDR